MSKDLQLQVSPEIAANESLLNEHVAKLCRVAPTEIQKIIVQKRSIDARQKAIKINLKLAVYFNGENYTNQKTDLPNYNNVSNKQEVIIT